MNSTCNGIVFFKNVRNSDIRADPAADSNSTFERHGQSGVDASHEGIVVPFALMNVISGGKLSS